MWNYTKLLLLQQVIIMAHDLRLKVEGMLCSSAGASQNEPPPELQQLALNFLATFFSRHLTEQQPSYICTRPENFFHT